MSNLATLPNQPAPLAFDQSQRDLIKRTIAPDATNDELSLFLHAAAQAGLDPLQKQIWFVKRSGRVSIQAGVDGLQARALRMPDCEGISSAVVYEKEEFVFDKKSGEVVSHQSIPFGSLGKLIGAWGVVRRAGKTPFVALIRAEEYLDTGSPLWRSKPAVMLEKVARSTALRRAYPEQFGGIYEPAEMGDKAHVEVVVSETPEPAVKKHHKALPEALSDVTPEMVAKAQAIEAARAEAPAAPVVHQTPKHVLAMWSRLLEEFGKDKAKTQAELGKAATTLWGSEVPPKHLWTESDCQALLKAATDVSF